MKKKGTERDKDYIIDRLDIWEGNKWERYIERVRERERGTERQRPYHR